MSRIADWPTWVWHLDWDKPRKIANTKDELLDYLFTYGVSSNEVWGRTRRECVEEFNSEFR